MFSITNLIKIQQPVHKLPLIYKKMSKIHKHQNTNSTINTLHQHIHSQSSYAHYHNHININNKLSHQSHQNNNNKNNNNIIQQQEQSIKVQIQWLFNTIQQIAMSKQKQKQISIQEKLFMKYSNVNNHNHNNNNSHNNNCNKSKEADNTDNNENSLNNSNTTQTLQDIIQYLLQEHSKSQTQISQILQLILEKMQPCVVSILTKLQITQQQIVQLTQQSKQQKQVIQKLQKQLHEQTITIRKDRQNYQQMLIKYQQNQQENRQKYNTHIQKIVKQYDTGNTIQVEELVTIVRQLQRKIQDRDRIIKEYQEQDKQSKREIKERRRDIQLLEKLNQGLRIEVEGLNKKVMGLQKQLNIVKNRNLNIRGNNNSNEKSKREDNNQLAIKLSQFQPQQQQNNHQNKNNLRKTELYRSNTDQQKIQQSRNKINNLREKQCKLLIPCQILNNQTPAKNHPLCIFPIQSLCSAPKTPYLQSQLEPQPQKTLYRVKSFDRLSSSSSINNHRFSNTLFKCLREDTDDDLHDHDGRSGHGYNQNQGGQDVQDFGRNSRVRSGKYKVKNMKSIGLNTQPNQEDQFAYPGSNQHIMSPKGILVSKQKHQFVLNKDNAQPNEPTSQSLCLSPKTPNFPTKISPQTRPNIPNIIKPSTPRLSLPRSILRTSYQNKLFLSTNNNISSQNSTENINANNFNNINTNTNTDDQHSKSVYDILCRIVSKRTHLRKNKESIEEIQNRRKQQQRTASKVTDSFIGAFNSIKESVNDISQSFYISPSKIQKYRSYSPVSVLNMKSKMSVSMVQLPPYQQSSINQKQPDSEITNKSNKNPKNMKKPQKIPSSPYNNIKVQSPATTKNKSFIKVNNINNVNSNSNTNINSDTNTTTSILKSIYQMAVKNRIKKV